jgi:hypothetical protein
MNGIEDSAGPRAGTSIHRPDPAVYRRVLVAVAELLPAFASGVVALTVAALVMVEPTGEFGFTRTTSEKVTVAPRGRVEAAAVAVPRLPTAGTELAHPDGAMKETTVAPGGRGSTRDAFAASSGPLFVTTIE